MAVGLVLTGPDGSHHRAARRLPHTGCNNEAELTALLYGLQAAQQAGAQALRIYTDSHVLLEQLALAPGRPPRPIVRLEPLFAQARQALQALGTVQLRWVPRRCNSEADALARAAAEALEV
jgi:ribonuclease HI